MRQICRGRAGRPIRRHAVHDHDAIISTAPSRPVLSPEAGARGEASDDRSFAVPPRPRLATASATPRLRRSPTPRDRSAAISIAREVDGVPGRSAMRSRRGRDPLRRGGATLGPTRDDRRRPAFVVARASRRRLHRPCSARIRGPSRSDSSRAPAFDASVANLRTQPAGACRSCFSDSAGPLPATRGRSQPWRSSRRRRRRLATRLSPSARAPRGGRRDASSRLDPPRECGSRRKRDFRSRHPGLGQCLGTQPVADPQVQRFAQPLGAGAGRSAGCRIARPGGSLRLAAASGTEGKLTITAGGAHRVTLAHRRVHQSWMVPSVSRLYGR